MTDSKQQRVDAPDLDSPLLYINRELSWLEFNHRVLAQGMAPDVPLLERLKFLSIVSSNLDEFFMIRVAGLKQLASAGVTARGLSGMTPDEQLAAVSERAHRMAAEHTEAVERATAELRRCGLHLLDEDDLAAEHKAFLSAHFASELMPVLTPLNVQDLDPFPALPGSALNLAVLLDLPSGPDGRPPIAVVPIPGNLPRYITVPAQGGLRLARIEQAMGLNVGRLFPQARIVAKALFRLTRDADVAVDEDDAADLLQAMEDVARTRRRRAVVRLEVSADAAPQLRKWLIDWCEVHEQDVYETGGLMDARALMGIANAPGFDELKAPAWPPQPPADLVGQDDLWQALQERDVLLFHPYESFEPVVSFLDTAADDPKVLAIKQTLYRTSGDSPIIAALARAAESGKQVTVLVELKARFDEEQNANWARRLEEAGCHVIYGIAGLKTHAKLLLIVRREAHGIRRYVHCSTGNYNDRTARIYSDVGFMTTDRDFAADASAFFNLLTGYSQEVGWQEFAISPRGIRRRILEMIDREIDASSLDHPGLIMAKVNSLHDRQVCRALYRASRAGVKVMLNVRGICCLRPGISGVSDGIEVTSIVDRFLEHSRIFYFRNGGHEEVYLSSADLMERNLDRRLEILFPVTAPVQKRRLTRALEVSFADNVKAWRLRADGRYGPPEPQDPPVRAQQEMFAMAQQAAEAGQAQNLHFRPLTSPDRP